MNTDLTKEQLDALEDDLAECNPRDAQANRLKRALRMARRTLQAEESLGRALEALSEQQRRWDLELSRLKFLNEDGGPKEAWIKECRALCQSARDEIQGSPKDLPPPLPCAPPAHSDVQP